MIPVFLSEQVDVLVLVKLILIKVFIGLIMGVVIDLIVRRSKKSYNMVERLDMYVIMTTVAVRQAYLSQR